MDFFVVVAGGVNGNRMGQHVLRSVRRENTDFDVFSTAGTPVVLLRAALSLRTAPFSPGEGGLVVSLFFGVVRLASLCCASRRSVPMPEEVAAAGGGVPILFDAGFSPCLTSAVISFFVS